MAIDKKTQPNIDNSNLSDFPNGRIRDDSGAGDGTAVDRNIYGDIHEFFAKIMRRANMAYSGISDSETSGYQLVTAMENLVGKNDKIYELSTVSGVINIPLDISILVESEFLICKSTFDLTAETTIKGTKPLIKSIVFEEPAKKFKAGDYLKIIYDGTSFLGCIESNISNINRLVGENDYLKGATEAEEYAAASQVKATTPYTNGLAFARRVIGLDSFMFLATAIRNGLYPKEHFAIVAGLGASNVKNIGWFAGFDILATGSLPVSGNITFATVVSAGADSYVTVTMQNPMTNINYYVRSYIESVGSLEFDNDILREVFKPISTTQFQMGFRELSSTIQILKVHIEVVQL